MEACCQKSTIYTYVYTKAERTTHVAPNPIFESTTRSTAP